MHGMFDKDKEIGRQLEATFKAGDEFVLFDVVIQPDRVETAIGPARKTTLTVVKLDPNTGKEIGDKFEVNTLASAIADKAEDASPDDFPAVVAWMKVHSANFNTDATVLQFIRDYADPVKF